MSTFPDNEPACVQTESSDIELVIDARSRDLGGFSVRRVLPSSARRLVGPFIFFDHMGPASFEIGKGIDVRPHPHINLATLTYLFDGEILHRDSLGSEQRICPGDVNWMIAGRGIVHSERTPPELRTQVSGLHGIQSWVALPKAEEDHEPQFTHHAASTIPNLKRPGVELSVIAGTAYGERSPVNVLSPTLYVAAHLEDQGELPVDGEHPERAVYVVAGAVSIAGRTFQEGSMAVLRAGAEVSVRAEGAARVMLVGGGKLDGERHIFWNFVSSDPRRIEQAKEAWREYEFPSIPGDALERIPLPGEED